MSLLFDAEAQERELRSADDAELLERSRRGDSYAFAELFRRYRSTALRVAARTSSAVDPEDVSAEAFTRVWQALRNGGGPDTAFRPYLNTSVRNVALNWRRGPQETPVEPQLMAEVVESADDTEVAIVEAELIGRAFRSLPARWQDVLWATEVEGVTTAELAERLGTSNNATAALCLRAREGLRNAWLAEHIDRRAAEPECRWVLEHLSAYTRHRLPQAQHQRVADHLDSCRSCRKAAARLDRVVAVLRISLFAGGATAGLLAASALTGGAAGGKLATATLQPSSWVTRLVHGFLQPHIGLIAMIGTVGVVSLSLGAQAVPTTSASRPQQAPSSAPLLVQPTGGIEPRSEPSTVVVTVPRSTPATVPSTSGARPSPTTGASAKPSPEPTPSPSEPTHPPFGSWPTLTPSPEPTQTPTTSLPTPSEPTPTVSEPTQPAVTPTPTPSPSEVSPTPSDPTPTVSEPTQPAATPSATPSSEPSASGEVSPEPTIGPTETVTSTELASPTSAAAPSTPPDETATPQPSPTPSCVLIWDFFLRIDICRA
jgi:RNA polymerase sigma factor (sigma-70 family)